MPFAIWLSAAMAASSSAKRLPNDRDRKEWWLTYRVIRERACDFVICYSVGFTSRYILTLLRIVSIIFTITLYFAFVSYTIDVNSIIGAVIGNDSERMPGDPGREMTETRA